MKIIITMDGGVIQAIGCDAPVSERPEIIVKDYDVGDSAIDDPNIFKDQDGDDVYVSEVTDMYKINKHQVNYYFSGEYKKHQSMKENGHE